MGIQPGKLKSQDGFSQLRAETEKQKFISKSKVGEGSLPWWSGGWVTTLPLQGGTGLIPGQRTGISHAMWHSPKIEKKKMLEKGPAESYFPSKPKVLNGSNNNG